MVTMVPAFGSNPLKSRMKSVAIERDELRAKQRARLAAESDRRRRGLREDQSGGMRSIVDRLDLRRALADETTVAKLRMAGFRGQNPLTKFLFFRLVCPSPSSRSRLSTSSSWAGLKGQPNVIKFFVCVVAAYGGFYAPVLYVSNRASKRKQSIQRAWPDALDLMLICVESGMSIEAAFRRVADEIGTQSVELAEEFVLTNRRAVVPAGTPAGLREPGEPHRTGDGEGRHPGADPGGALRHADRIGPARPRQRKPRHAHERGREEGCGPAAQAHRSDDPVLPAGAVHRHPRPGRHHGQPARHLLDPPNS